MPLYSFYFLFRITFKALQLIFCKNNRANFEDKQWIFIQPKTVHSETIGKKRHWDTLPELCGFLKLKLGEK